MDTNMEDFNDTNEQKDRENLCKKNLNVWNIQGWDDSPLYWFQNRQDQNNFVKTLEGKGLPVDECMAAYYVLVDHKHFDPSAVKATLLAWCDPKKLVQCETQEELIDAIIDKEDPFWANNVYELINTLSALNDDSPYF